MRSGALAFCMILLGAWAATAIAEEPTTPLGKWMKPNLGAPLAAQDFPTLQKNLEFVAARPPSSPDYPKWAEYANAGARAAGKEHLKDVKTSCKVCHEAYKEKYKKDFANRPFP